MRANTFKSVLSMCLLSAQLLTYSTAFAKSSGGSMDGGGGDASEERVSEIRTDVLSWISKGGAAALIVKNAGPSEYVSKMSEILQPQKVIVNFVENDDSQNDELVVSANGKPRVCRGFTSKKDLKFHILCNISKFKNSSESEQYRIIHHEYAGLVNLESDDDAASDYEVSDQVISYLTVQAVLKLAVKKPASNGQNVNPLIRISKSKYIGKGFYEVTLAASNVQDVVQIILSDDLGTNRESCHTFSPKLTFNDAKLEQTIILEPGDCKFSNAFIRYSSFMVEFKDGTIKTLEHDYMPYAFKIRRDNTEPKNIKVIGQLLSERKGSYIPKKFHTRVKTIEQDIKFTYKVSAQDMNGYKGVIFNDQEEYFSNDPVKLADVINSKEILVNALYEELHFQVSCGTYYHVYLPFCGLVDMVEKGDFRLTTPKEDILSTITLIKKGNWAEAETLYTVKLEK